MKTSRCIRPAMGFAALAALAVGILAGCKSEAPPAAPEQSRIAAPVAPEAPAAPAQGSVAKEPAEEAAPARPPADKAGRWIWDNGKWIDTTSGSSDGQPAASQAAPAAPTQGTAAKEPVEEAAPVAEAKPPATEKAGEGAAPKAAPEAADPNRAPLAIALPRPQFTGTPKNIKFGGHVEKPSSKPRPEFYAPKGAANVALKKPVTSSEKDLLIGTLGQVTDGDKEGIEGSYVELGPGRQWAQIDLKETCEIYAIVLWHYHGEPQVYGDVVIQVADDADFIENVRAIFNNDYDNSAGLGLGGDLEYLETYEGRLIPVKGVKARYVRLYSSGNTSNDFNRYTEVEVYGKPAK